MVTTEMLAGLTTALTANLTIVLPVAIGLFAVLFGVRMIPKIIKLFAK